MRTPSDGGPESFVREHGPAVYRLAFARLRSVPDAEDVYQEVFLRYMKKRPVFRDKEHERAWFLRVTLNCCKDLFRSPWRKRIAPLEDAEGLPFETPEEWELHWALGKLPEKDRAVLHLAYWEELSSAETAEVLGCSPAAARQRLKRAREKLKSILDEEEFENAERNLQTHE